MLMESVKKDESARVYIVINPYVSSTGAFQALFDVEAKTGSLLCPNRPIGHPPPPSEISPDNKQIPPAGDAVVDLYAGTSAALLQPQRSAYNFP
ncbi:hypothetical protein L1887_22395 [Cichorium endivia]|nr:hypothetical protein L1887_22395 [Cichorium endivia]